MSKNSSIIQNRLKELMLAHNLNEKETAEKAGLNQPTVHRILSGESKSPRTQNLLKLAKAFNVSLAYITECDVSNDKSASSDKDNIETLSPAALRLVRQIQSAKNISESDFILLSHILARFEVN